MNKGEKRKYQEIGLEMMDNATVPKNLMIARFAESRAQEISALNEHVQMKTVNKLVLETLPKHMHRRAMSHDIRRWPRRLREMVKKQYENRPDKRARKPPSRKHRRRPRNLLAEYNRRKKKNIWLETHIWHAKRFHMVKKWGYHLASTPNTKCSRVTYKSTVNYCLMQDISFMCCIEISGPEADIQSGFSHLTNPATGPGICAKSYLKGNREGSTIVYMYDEFPNRAIGPITFFWKPLYCVSGESHLSSGGTDAETSSNRNRCLWLWCHPSCYSQLWNQLTKVFHNVIPCHLDATSNGQVTSGQATGSATAEKTFSKEESNIINTDHSSGFQTKKLSSIPNGAGNKSLESRVSVKSLKDDLVRFRLIGPLSIKVLTNAVEVASVRWEKSKTNLKAGSEESQNSEDVPWWARFYHSEECQSKCVDSQILWKNLALVKNPAELPSHCVLGMTVTDPRKRLPKKKTYAKPSPVDARGNCLDITDHPLSPLWEEDIRKEVKRTKISEQEFNKIRFENLIPGYPINLGRAASRIPIMLIQKPGCRMPISSKCEERIGFGSGVDVILPTGWGMAFWVAFVYQGARVGGLVEAQHILRDSGCLSFPEDFPDTEAGSKEMLSIRDGHVQVYVRRPPAKRPNFLKLNVPCPYFADYLQLLTVLSSDQDLRTFNILRDRKKLMSLVKFLTYQHKPPREKQIPYSFRDLFSDNLYVFKTSLVPVTVKMVSKGCPEPFSMICVPNKEDLKKQRLGIHKDPLEPLLKNYPPVTSENGAVVKQTELCRLKLEEGQNHLLPLNSPSRKIIGFVNMGKYTYGTACGFGVGFCCLAGLQLLSAENNLTVLVRSTQSQQYRFAKISVVFEK